MDDLSSRFNAAPYYRLLGMVGSSSSPGTSEVVLPFDQKLTQLYGGIHGGAMLTLADSALNMAAATTLAENELIGTVELSMQFLAPAEQRDLVATGRVIRRGKTLVFGECTIRAGDQEIAKAHGICFVRPLTKPLDSGF